MKTGTNLTKLQQATHQNDPKIQDGQSQRCVLRAPTCPALCRRVS